MTKIAIIREGKTPPDARTPLLPRQAVQVQQKFDVDVQVEASKGRIIEDQAYAKAGIQLYDKIDDADIYLGIKEVPIPQLIPDKTYLFFSHTSKKQAYNRDLLRAILDKRIRLIDYELLTNPSGRRVIAFGYFAGMVGAHNALWTWGQRSATFAMKRMHQFADYQEAKQEYAFVQWPPLRIVLTGTGRVGKGAADVLRDMGIREVSPEAYLQHSFPVAVFTQLGPQHYVKPKKGTYDKNEFYENPALYDSAFASYWKQSDIFINGIYWDIQAPVFFTAEDVADDRFSIQVIADVTCDIAPLSSIPSTLFASTIDQPVFGYDAKTHKAVAAHSTKLDMMTIDNLPNELPKDASAAFGKQMIDHVIGPLLDPSHPMIEKATIAKDGRLCPSYAYLQDFVDGKE